MRKTWLVMNAVYSRKHGLLGSVCVHIKLGFHAGLECVYTNLDVLGSDIEAIGDVFDESQHFLEVSGTDRSRRIQQEDDISLSVTF